MYYPLSQITINLHTNGGEFINESTQEIYIGYYWTNSSGKFYTGKTPSDKPNSILLPITEQSTEFVNQDNKPALLYNILNKEILIGSIPQYNPLLPEIQDYKNQEFRRYFCKKTNELVYIEINNDSYDKLINKDPELLWQLYEPFYITWILVGEKENVARINKNIVELIMQQKKYYQFNNYLKNDFLKYFKP